MGRKNSPSANKELNELIAQYETAKAENRQLYLDALRLVNLRRSEAYNHRLFRPLIVYSAPPSGRSADRR